MFCCLPIYFNAIAEIRFPFYNISYLIRNFVGTVSGCGPFLNSRLPSHKKGMFVASNKLINQRFLDDPGGLGG